MDKMDGVLKYSQQYLDKMDGVSLKCGSKSFLRNRKFLRNGMLFLDLYILEILLLFGCKILKILMLFEYELHNHP